MTDETFDRERIVERIKTMLRLTGSSNEFEATNAAVLAQQLMEQYAIKQEEVDQKSVKADRSDVIEKMTNVYKSPAETWVIRLHILVGHATWNLPFSRQMSKERELWYVGRQDAIEFGEMLFEELFARLNYLSKLRMREYQAQVGNNTTGSKHPYAYRVSWLSGALDTLSSRLKDQRDHLSTGTLTSLAIRRESENAKFYNQAHPTHQTFQLPKNQTNQAGIAQGREDGKHIPLGGADGKSVSGLGLPRPGGSGAKS